MLAGSKKSPGQALQGRVLVTGGAGFIGSALVWALNREGVDDILVVDRLGSDEKWRNLVPLSYADYMDADELLERMRRDDARLAGVTGVFHLGACSATTERDAAYLARNNFDYTKECCRWALAAGARFVYASSAATYGDGARGMSDECELSTLRPLNMYGYSKHMFDLWARRRGLLAEIVGLKYFNIYGPNEDHKGDMRSLVNKAFHEIKQTGGMRLFQSHRADYAHGEQVRDFLYVKDAVSMTIHLMRAEGAAGLYNVGSGVATSWNQLARALFAAMGREARIEYVPMPEALRGKYQYRTQADTRRLRASGWTAAATPIEQAVRDYVERHLEPDLRLGDEARGAEASA
jgi:ADP-L-glycero-D-manno-heptose 6-epimerase